jgi:hypothetical protein
MNIVRKYTSGEGLSTAIFDQIARGMIEITPGVTFVGYLSHLIVEDPESYGNRDEFIVCACRDDAQDFKAELRKFHRILDSGKATNMTFPPDPPYNPNY